MERWRTIFRDGFAPGFSEIALHAASIALRDDDPRIVQGATTTPPPLLCVQDWPVEAACFIGYCGWKGEGLRTVGEVEVFHAKACYDADQRIGELAGCRHFLNWYDDSPRDEMRRELLLEIDAELRRRQTNPALVA
jgi:hypothetical protein